MPKLNLKRNKNKKLRRKRKKFTDVVNASGTMFQHNEIFTVMESEKGWLK